MTCLSAILACMLALVVASPLCCCAAGQVAAGESSCCGGVADASGEQDNGHHCPCASEDPREIPGPALNRSKGPGPFAAAPLALPDPVAATFAAAPRVLPNRAPAVPWHAPPAERRARLMIRLI